MGVHTIGMWECGMLKLGRRIKSQNVKGTPPMAGPIGAHDINDGPARVC